MYSKLKINKTQLSQIMAIVVVAMFFWYLFANLNDFKFILNINLFLVSILIFIYIGGIITNGVFLKWSIALFDKDINVLEGVKVAFISTIGNFFAPSGTGLGLRAIYLKKAHELSYSFYVSIVFCNYVIAFLINAVIGLVSLYFLNAYDRPEGIILGLLFLGVLILSIASFFVRVKSRTRFGKLGKVLSVLSSISSGWTIILKNKKQSMKLVLVNLVNAILMILGTYIIMQSLGINLSFSSIALFSVLGSFSIFINITPGNLGVKEAIYIATSTVIGLSVPQILAASLIDRSVMFIMIFILWIVFGRKINLFMKKQSV